MSNVLAMTMDVFWTLPVPAITKQEFETIGWNIAGLRLELVHTLSVMTLHGIVSSTVSVD